MHAAKDRKASSIIYRFRKDTEKTAQQKRERRKQKESNNKKRSAEESALLNPTSKESQLVIADCA